MNFENHQNNSRPRPQAVPEIVSMSPGLNAGSASTPDVLRPIAAEEAVSASADALHPLRKPALAQNFIKPEIAPDLEQAISVSSRRSQHVVPEIAPDIPAANLALSRRRWNIVAEIAPDIPSATSASSRRSQHIVAEIAPDLRPSISKAG